MKKNLIETLTVIVVLSWIPFGILAFVNADFPLYIKFLTITGVSFVSMLAWILKNE